MNQTFDVGTGKETSINDLAQMIFEISSKQVPVEHAPIPYPQLESAKAHGPPFVENPLTLDEALKQLLKQ